MSKPREFWLYQSMKDHVTEHEPDVNKWKQQFIDDDLLYHPEIINCIEKKAYDNALKILEEMAESYKKYAKHIDTCFYLCGSSEQYTCDCGLNTILNKYEQFKKELIEFSDTLKSSKSCEDLFHNKNSISSVIYNNCPSCGENK